MDERDRKAMQWQHTRSRIGNITMKQRHEGVTEICHDDDFNWELVQEAYWLMMTGKVRSICMFGTLVDGEPFNMMSRGSENHNNLVAACSYLNRRLLDESAAHVDEFGKSS